MAKALIQYGLDNYSKKIIANKNVPIDIISIPKSRNKDIEVYPVNNYSTLIKTGDSLDLDIQIDENIKLPLKELDKIGKVSIYKNGQKLDEIDLIVREDIKKGKAINSPI